MLLRYAGKQNQNHNYFALRWEYSAIINQVAAHLLIIGNAWEQNKKEQAVV